jgi:hypothetical protein
MTDEPNCGRRRWMAVWIGGGRLGAGRRAPLMAKDETDVHNELILCEFVRRIRLGAAQTALIDHLFLTYAYA